MALLTELDAFRASLASFVSSFFEGRDRKEAFLTRLKQRRPVAFLLNKAQSLSGVTGLLCFILFERRRRSGRLLQKGQNIGGLWRSFLN